MHICFITSEFPKKGFPHGGVGTFVYTISKKMIEMGLQISVIGINYTDNEEVNVIDGINVYRIKPNKIKGLAWYFNTKAIFKTVSQINRIQKIDIVETSELGLAFCSKIKNIKYVIRLHGGHHFFSESENRKINWWKGWQEKRSFKKADAFIAVSEYVKNHTSKYLSYYNKPIQIIYYPINVAMFSPIVSNNQNNSIVFAGTICEKKGVPQLIQSFPMIKDCYPDAVLHLYGRDWKSPNGSSYIKMLHDVELPKIHPLDEDVIFHGSVDYESIPKIYASATVCVFPSHMETLGLVAPEAMAMEKSVIFTNLGPGKEVIEDGVNGLLVNPHDPKAIAKAILHVFNNPEKMVKIGKNARITVLRKFEPTLIAKQNIEWYLKIKNVSNV